jgi:hypothetical protein
MSLNLEDPAIYPDLALSVTALSPVRMTAGDQFLNSARDGNETCQFVDHYLPPSQVMRYLVRCEPFNSQQIEDQTSGLPSIPAFWDRLRSSSDPARECIPEFFTFPSFLQNETEGDSLNHIELPSWAHDSTHYIYVNRIALESAFASSRLSLWIDLIFGIYRNDKAHYTMFPLYTYPEFQPGKDVDAKSLANSLLTQGSCPLQLFNAHHPTRQPRTKPKPFPPFSLGEISSPVHFVKQIAFSRDGFSLDARTPACTKSKCSVSNPGEFWGVSNSLGLALFGTGFDRLVTLVDIQTGFARVVCTDADVISCATIVGGRFLLTAGDGIVRVWKLTPEWQKEIPLVTTLMNHATDVITIAGCADNGLMVSIDRDNILVFHTIVTSDFIRRVPLAGPRDVRPMAAVFKGGIVVVVQPSESVTHVSTFDSRGAALKSVEIAGSLSKLTKYYHHDTGEFVLLAHPGKAVYLYNVVTLGLVATLTGSFGDFCPVKGGAAILVDAGDSLVTHGFEDPIMLAGSIMPI